MCSLREGEVFSESAAGVLDSPGHIFAPTFVAAGRLRYRAESPGRCSHIGPPLARSGEKRQSGERKDAECVQGPGTPIALVSLDAARTPLRAHAPHSTEHRSAI